ncbi:MAG: diguanylate cyclase (GGDEF)-like protein/PAS domain S-box-containing protein [Rubritalea sp.]|jgi:diguanylate cyclase (GGDEF)-like protein/PAS domain S-box-containing protein
MIVELIYDTTLSLTLSLLYGFIVIYFYTNTLIKEVLAGIVFGWICVIGMISPIEISPEVFIDPQSVVLGISALFGGPLVAIIAAGMAGGYRLLLGGLGLYVGLSLIITSACIGLGYRYSVQKGWAKINLPQLLLFGLLLHLVEILLFIQLPANVFSIVMATVAIPLVLTFTPVTAFLGLLLKSLEDRVKMEVELRQSQAKLSDHLLNTPLAAISWDENFHAIQWNKAAENIFGYSANEAIGKHIIDLIVGTDSKAEVEGLIKSLLENKGGVRSSNNNLTKDGRTIACEWYNTTLLDSVGKVIGVASLCEDVTARKQSEEMIWTQANYDSLTGMANRQMANEHLEHEIKMADRSNKSIALLFLDLDQFKDINDTLGHSVGDNLLIEVAKRLRSYVRDIDTIARLGGDEFVIIMGGLESPDHVDRIASNLLKKTAEPYTLGHDVVHISTSIGIALYPQDASDSVEMLRNADQAMYAAKDNGGNRFQYFRPSMQQNALSRMSLISDLRPALLNNEFQLYYQPIVNLVNGDIRKAEALIRWQHPTRGFVPPDEFISIAEETKLIVDIGDWVFREACRQSARWRDSFDPSFQISINTSPVQYKSDAFSAKDWFEHMQTLKLTGDAIAVEITEGTLMESEGSVGETLLAFRDANIQVSLDDFGTGYSSLSSLKKLDVHYLKIDKSFVDNLEPNSDDLALCEAIIVMAHKLDLKVIAEGIETERQRDLLIAASCDYGQGYLFSKPVAAIEFEKLLRS